MFGMPEPGTRTRNPGEAADAVRDLRWLCPDLTWESQIQWPGMVKLLPWPVRAARG